MKERWGQVWLLSILLGIVGISLALWQTGQQQAPEAQLLYAHGEASRILGCSSKLLHPGVRLDLNQNGFPEYLFSCDSELTQTHRRFIMLEFRKRKVRVLLHHDYTGWVRGQGPEAVRGYSWLLDRGEGVIQALPVLEREDTFVQPLRLVWNDQKEMFQFAAP
ncbi:MAG: hypothetical protein NZ580_02825 [Bacteroidia bacterium]|nr:hypothetical protein [Bacteroidia bacterium]MDW8235719.1 hypothetical protein [Bacteroidia bacterium]